MKTSAPALLKARRRHTIYFVALLVPLLIWSAPVEWLQGDIHELLDLLGFTLIIVCVLGRSYSSLFVGGKKNAMIVKDGVYAIVRNPLYVFSFIGVIGVGLQSGRLSITAFLILAFAYYYRKVVAKEEAFLLHHYGEEYQHYCDKTPRWIPDFRLWYSPDEILVQPKMVMRTIKDALLFCAPIILFECIEVLQEKSIIPVYLNLP